MGLISSTIFWGSGALYLTWALSSLLLTHSKFEAHAAVSGLAARAMHGPISWPVGGRFLSGLVNPKHCRCCRCACAHPQHPVPSRFPTQSQVQDLFSSFWTLLLAFQSLPSQQAWYYSSLSTLVIFSTRNEKPAFLIKDPRGKVPSVSSGTLPKSSTGRPLG